MLRKTMSENVQGPAERTQADTEGAIQECWKVLHQAGLPSEYFDLSLPEAIGVAIKHMQVARDDRVAHGPWVPSTLSEYKGQTYCERCCVMFEYRDRKPCVAKPRASEAKQSPSPANLRFPTHLRKMWSGGEVQAWLDEQLGRADTEKAPEGGLQRYRAWQSSQEMVDRLEWLLRNLPGDALRKCVGALSDTSDIKDFLAAIDVARGKV